MSKTALPRGWTEVRLTKVAEINPPNPDVPPEDDTLVSFVPMAAVQVMARGIATSETRPWREVRKGYKRFQNGDVLFAKITPCMENGKLAVATELHNGVGAGSTEFHVLRPSGAIRSDLLAYYLLRDDFRASARSNMKGTAGQLRVPQQFLEAQKLPVPPTPEQKLIVERIDSYFSRLDHVTAALEQVRRNLKRYRASILKAAVEGRLVPTEAELARAEGRDYEPATVLLQRILAERRRRWEERKLARMKAAGKIPKNNKWKAKYKEPAAPDTATLPPLPEGWCWAQVGQLGDVCGGLTQNSKRRDLRLQIPFLRVANVYADQVQLDTVREIGVTESEKERTQLVDGDLLIVEGNGSVDQIGRVALWKGEISPCVHQNHLIKVRFKPPALARWTLGWLLSPSGRTAIETIASSTSGLYTLSLSKVRHLPLPLPPLAEQDRIIQMVDQQRMRAKILGARCDVDVRRCNHLRQTVVEGAFHGRLNN